MAENLQHEFQAALKIGHPHAITFLVANYARNRRFVVEKLGELLDDDTLLQLLLEKRIEIDQRVKDFALLSVLYTEFRALSERQKFKRGGFRGFVSGRSEDREQFSRVERFCGRFSEPLNSYGMNGYRRYRINYRDAAAACNAELANCDRDIRQVREGWKFLVDMRA